MSNNFNTYVINLKKDKEKWQKINDHFKNTGLKLIRFDAIYGKTVDKKTKNKYTTKLCNIFCPNGVVGCGISHIMLNEIISKNDNNDFALILEDDVIPSNNIKKEILNYVKNMKFEWDIIKLFDQGFCNSKSKFNYNNSLISKLFPCGSTAAYLVSKNGSKKIANMKLYNHIDLQYQLNSELKIYKMNKKLIYTDELDSSISSNDGIINSLNIFNHRDKKLNMPISFFLNQKFIKIFNIEISYFNFFIIGIIAIYKFYNLEVVKIYIILTFLYFIIGYLFYT